MIILLAIILIVFLIHLTIKKAKLNINTTRHIILRIGTLLLATPLIFLICYLIDGRSGMLGGLYASYYFFGVWLLYLLSESIALFVVKQSNLARTSLFLFLISAFIVGMGTMIYFNNLH